MFLIELMEQGSPTLSVGGSVSWAWPGTEWKRELAEHTHVHIPCFIPTAEMQWAAPPGLCRCEFSAVVDWTWGLKAAVKHSDHLPEWLLPGHFVTTGMVLKQSVWAQEPPTMGFSFLLMLEFSLILLRTFASVSIGYQSVMFLFCSILVLESNNTGLVKRNLEASLPFYFME